MRVYIILSFCLFLLGCNDTKDAQSFTSPDLGAWLVNLNLGEEELPFELELIHNQNDWDALITNGDEHIEVEDVVVSGDSIRLTMPLFDSDFRGKFTSNSAITGVWTNYQKGPDYKIPFTAIAGITDRFEHHQANINVTGEWDVLFSPNSNDAYPAIGSFTQHESTVTGTFITETGDYRFLEGVISGNEMLLSCFDGSHAFLFKATTKGDSMLGEFWSGNHWQESWVGHKNPDAILTNPDSLTFLKEGYDMIDFSFKDIDGNTVSPKDEVYKDKVLVVQIMGTWCPNCIDETRLLNETYAQFHDNGLEVIALAFEKHKDPNAAHSALQRFKTALNVEYPLAHAGYSNKDSAAVALPFLNHVMSYPTCIVIDKKGVVRKIRTGFYGPGTGNHYLTYKSEFVRFLDKLLDEPA